MLMRVIFNLRLPLDYRTDPLRLICPEPGSAHTVRLLYGTMAGFLRAYRINPVGLGAAC
jgi:hypothetical protein